MNKMKEILSCSGSAEMMVIYYMLDKGIEKLLTITEDDIKTVHGHGIMTEEFCQSIVRAAVQIAKECDTHEILKYIRCEARFNPRVTGIELWKENMKNNSWEYLCNELDVDSDENECLYIKCIAEETDYEKY